ncbi:hypothetical protein P692DRAFT_201668339, partial [Suillus brevipes Sb2]
LIREFDIPATKSDGNVSTDKELEDLARDLHDEERQTVDENPNKGTYDDDSDEGWVDEVQALTNEERKKLDVSIKPLRHILVKLRKLAYKLIHSTTLLLPAWKTILEELKLGDRIMPRDVSTRWNSTFDMLEFALEYRQAIDAITDTRKLGLGKYELKEYEWALVKQLRDVLKV